MIKEAKNRFGPSIFIALKFFSSRTTDKNLFRHIRGAILGIALSLVPLVVVLEVTDGMIAGITRRYIELGSYHFRIREYNPDKETNYSAVAEKLQKEGIVKTAFPYFQETCLIYSKEGRAGVSVRSLPEDIYSKDSSLKEYLEFSEGEFDLSDPSSILLSSSIAQKTEASVGDEVKLLTAYAMPGRPMILRPVTFTVKGIFTTGYRELDEISIYIGNSRAEKIFNSAPFIGVKVEDPYKNVDKTAALIRQHLPEGFLINSWYRINYTLYKSLETTKKLLLFVMILILCVASLNISSAMIMMVLSRKKEIAILKSIGFTKQKIAFSFLLTGFLIGTAGTFAGVVVGIIAAANINTILAGVENLINLFIACGYGVLSFFQDESVQYSYFSILDSGYYLEKIPTVLDFFGLFAVTVASLTLSCAASFLPSYRAGAIKPIEILQKN